MSSASDDEEEKVEVPLHPSHVRHGGGQDGDEAHARDKSGPDLKCEFCSFRSKSGEAMKDHVSVDHSGECQEQVSTFFSFVTDDEAQ